MKILRTNPVLRIPLLYALFGLLWILFTDRLLLWLVPDLEQLARWQTIKGWLFVAVSTVLIFLLQAEAQRRQQRARAGQKRSEIRYRHLFRQLRQVMDSVPGGVFLLGPGGEVLVANPHALEYLKLLAGAGIGDRLSRLGNRSLDTLLASPPPGTWHEIEVGDQIFNLLPRRLEAGPVAQGWVIILRDGTEERAVREQMQQQARLAAIGQLAAGIAHDFNNIINVILLYMELIEKEKGIPESTQKQLATINEQAQQAAMLVEQILDFSRRTLLERKTLDLHAFLEEQRTLLQQTLPENIETTVIFEAEGAALIRADGARLQQAVLNLALNARDAMPNGGRLQFELGTLQVEVPRRAPVPGMESGRWFRLTVTDNGHGIGPEMVDHVFEPFFTTKPPGKGTGLGLAQVHGIVGQHGGYITMDSEVKKGTTFTIYLPAWLPRSDGPVQLAHLVQDRGDASAEDEG